MILAEKLKKGDKVAIVSLSRGLLGEPFIKHELDLGVKRLKEMGLNPVVMPNADKGMDYLDKHPEARANDLKLAFADEEIKAIICAIGGNDTYRTYQYLLEDEEFIATVRKNPKIFTGFSDTTMNHLMFYKLGLSTLYGVNLLVDLAELADEMLPYTKETFERYFDGKPFRIEPSEFWYEDRPSYAPDQMGKDRVSHAENRGYEVLNGKGVVEGKLYGGCIESIYDGMRGASAGACEKYGIFPTTEEFAEIVLFLETSECKASPETLREMLAELKSRGILSAVKGIIVGKPADEVYYSEYKEVYKEVFADLSTPVLYNMNFGHSVPRCVLPYGVKARVDYDNKTVEIVENFLL